VVPDLRGVVEQALLVAVLRNLADEFDEVELLELGSLDRLVRLVDIALVVLAVVEGERLAGNMRCERVFGIGQRGEFEHDNLPSSLGFRLDSPPLFHFARWRGHFKAAPAFSSP
jgi:hypothetical protein